MQRGRGYTTSTYKNQKTILKRCTTPIREISPDKRNMQVKTTFSKKDLSCSFMLRSPPRGGRYRLGRQNNCGMAILFRDNWVCHPVKD